MYFCCLIKKSGVIFEHVLELYLFEFSRIFETKIDSNGSKFSNLRRSSNSVENTEERYQIYYLSLSGLHLDILKGAGQCD